MYDIILDQIIDDIQNFGYIATIIISEDYFDSMTKREQDHLESFVDPNSGVKWMISTEREQYWSFRYSCEPMVFEDEF